MQEMYSLINGAIKCLEIPDPDVFVLPEIRWGAFDELFTPAYWRGQAWQHQQLGTYECFRLGRTLEEELAACLLGGFGMKAELGLAAFSRLLERGLLQTLTRQETFRAVLSEDFDLY